MSEKLKKLLDDWSEGHKDFSAIIRETFEAESATPSEFADEFGVSIPSVKRWATGKNLPHPIVREIIVKHLRRRLPKA